MKAILVLLNNFMRTVPFLGILGLLMGGFQGLLIAAAASVVISICTELFSDMLGSSSVNMLFGFGRRTSTLRERLAGDLNQARFHKMKQNYDSAIAKLEKILALDPDFPEALFVKAQVLWEGYRDYSAARECLIRITKIEPDKKAVLNRWAMSLAQ